MSMLTPRSGRYARLGAVVLVIGTLAIAYRLGVFSQVADPKVLARTLVAMGPWGYAAFVATYTVLQPFGVPGSVFIAAAPLIWPWQTAFVLSMTGTMFASVVGFSFARFVAKDWVSARIPARLRRYNDALERDALQTVVLLRLILWMPQVLHSFFGVSKVGFWTHFWGSLLGYVPPLLLVSYLGGEMFDASARIRPGAWPIFAGLLLASLLINALFRVSERCRRARSSRRCHTKPPDRNVMKGHTMKKYLIGLLGLLSLPIVAMLTFRTYKDIAKKRAFTNTYAIQNIGTGKDIRVHNAGIADRTKIILYSHHEWECVTWRFIQVEESTFLLQNLYTQKTFQPTSSPEAGVHLWQQSLGGSHLQYWEFLKQPDETYLIRLKGTELYVTAPSAEDDSAIVLAQRDDSDRQRWKLVRQTPQV